MEEKFSYWQVWYKTCEENIVWDTAKAPIDYSETQVIDYLNNNCVGGCGSDPAEFINAEEICEKDCTYYCIE